MTSTRVVLTIEHKLHDDLLKHLLCGGQGFEIVGEATDPIGAMALIAQAKPDVWIHSWDEGPELQATLSHIYATNPGIAVIRISPNEPAGFLQMQVNSLTSLLAFASRQRHVREAV